MFYAGDSYKFRVRAVNILGESRPSTPSKPYVVSSSHRVPVAGPIAGPHITYTEAINETTIMLKWMVSKCVLFLIVMKLNFSSEYHVSRPG